MVCPVISYPPLPPYLKFKFRFPIANNREGLRPDPAHDEIKVLFYCLQSRREDVIHNGRRSGTCIGIILVTDPAEAEEMPRYALNDCTVDVVDSEVELLNMLIDKVRHWDPEVLTGFELESWSWGYVMRRGRELGRCSTDLVSMAYERGKRKCRGTKELRS